MCSSLWVCAHVVCTCLSTARPNWLVIKLEALNKYKRNCLLFTCPDTLIFSMHVYVYWFTQWFKQWIVFILIYFFLPLNSHLFVIVTSTKKWTPLFFIYFQFTCYLQRIQLHVGVLGLDNGTNWGHFGFKIVTMYALLWTGNCCFDFFYSLLQMLIAAKNWKIIFIWIILVKQFKDIQQLIKNIV